MTHSYSLQIPPQVFCGAGAADELPDMLHARGVRQVCLLIDRAVYASDLTGQLLKTLQSNLGGLHVVTDIPPEPEEGQVRGVFERVREAACDGLVAIGGGSVMDTAKLISVMLTNPDYYADLTDKTAICKPGLPLIAVPTSAGTGSEATPNAIVLLPEKKLKVGIVHPFFMPGGVILDPRFTVSLPKSVTAATGIDALCHCVETLISKKATPFTELYARKGLSLIARYLRRAYEDGTDLEAREAMLTAAFYGGVAITSSSTVAVHALSYPLGGTYRIAHGVSNAILLVPVMRYNMDALGDKLPLIAEDLGLATDGKTQEALGKAVVDALAALVRDVHIPEKLTQFGVMPQDLEALTLAASQVHRLLDQNPKEMSLEDIRNIYAQLL